MHFSYLIDSQASQQMHIDVEDEDKTYRPIKIRLYTPIINHKVDLIDLSREQAIMLIEALSDSIKKCPDFSGNTKLEYPGKVV